MGSSTSRDDTNDKIQLNSHSTSDAIRKVSLRNIELEETDEDTNASSNYVPSMSLTQFLSRTPEELRNKSDSLLVPQIFSNILGYSTDDFESVILHIEMFLDCRELCLFSSVCKLFRKIEIENESILWKNLYKSHKMSAICLSTNPFHMLKIFERYEMIQKETSNPSIDHLFHELSKSNVQEWKETCLKYVFVKRKLISESYEYTLLRNLSRQYKQQKEQSNKQEQQVEKRLSYEAHKSRRVSRKILKTFRDTDEEDDDFGDDWNDEDDNGGSTAPTTPAVNIAPLTENKLSLSIQFAKKLTPNISSDSEHEFLEKSNDNFKDLSLTSRFLNQMGIVSSKGIFDSASHNNNDTSKQNSQLLFKFTEDKNDDNHLDSWGSDSNEDELANSNLSKRNEKTISISDISLKMDTNKFKSSHGTDSFEDNNVPKIHQPNEKALSSKSQLLNLYNDDDDNEEDIFGSEESNEHKISEKSESRRDMDASKPIFSQSNSLEKQRQRLATFCDDDDDEKTEDEDLSFTPSVKLKQNSKENVNINSTSFDEETSDGELVRQEVLEQETLTLDDLISNLTDETHLKETYLSLSNADTQKFHSQLYSLMQKTYMDEESSSMIDTMHEVTMEPNEWPTTLSFYSQKKGQGVRVKLVFIEPIQTPNPAKLCHPLIKQFGSTDESFEYLYPALIIGPWLLHWNPRHSLIIPRKITSGLMSAQARIHKIAEIFNLSLDDVINIIAPEIVTWNATALHDLHNSNGQHFIDKIIISLGIGDVLRTNRIGRTLSDYVGVMREEGRAALVFKVDLSDKYYAFLQNNEQFALVNQESTSQCVLHFKTHQDLDHFSKQLLLRNPNFTTSHCQDYSLLVIFDLMFWAKHLHFPNHPSFKPLKMNVLYLEEHERSNMKNDLLCPFGRPFD